MWNGSRLIVKVNKLEVSRWTNENNSYDCTSSVL